jgi:hypothetical protein
VTIFVDGYLQRAAARSFDVVFLWFLVPAAIILATVAIEFVLLNLSPGSLVNHTVFLVLLVVKLLAPFPFPFPFPFFPG